MLLAQVGGTRAQVGGARAPTDPMLDSPRIRGSPCPVHPCQVALLLRALLNHAVCRQSPVCCSFLCGCKMKILTDDRWPVVLGGIKKETRAPRGVRLVHCHEHHSHELFWFRKDRSPPNLWAHPKHYKICPSDISIIDISGWITDCLVASGAWDEHLEYLTHRVATNPPKEYFLRTSNHKKIWKSIYHTLPILPVPERSEL